MLSIANFLYSNIQDSKNGSNIGSYMQITFRQTKYQSGVLMQAKTMSL
jgi:hypothetical protein